jgi:hypothetical protein
VHYVNGEVQIIGNDLSSSGFGLNWGHTRSYSNRLSSQTDGLNGNGWVVKQWPYVVQASGAPVCVINDTIYNAVWFDLVGGAYVARFFVQSALVEDTANKQFIYTDAQGIITKFYSYDSSIPAARQGRFKSVTDLGGNETVATYNSTTNLPVSLVLSSGASSCGFYQRGQQRDVAVCDFADQRGQRVAGAICVLRRQRVLWELERFEVGHHPAVYWFGLGDDGGQLLPLLQGG